MLEESTLNWSDECGKLEKEWWKIKLGCFIRDRKIQEDLTGQVEDMLWAYA